MESSFSAPSLWPILLRTDSCSWKHITDTACSTFIFKWSLSYALKVLYSYSDPLNIHSISPGNSVQIPLPCVSAICFLKTSLWIIFLAVWLFFLLPAVRLTWIQPSETTVGAFNHIKGIIHSNSTHCLLTNRIWLASYILLSGKIYIVLDINASV